MSASVVTQSRWAFAPHAITAASMLALVALAPACATTQPRGSSVTVEGVAMTKSTTTRTTTDGDGTSQTETVAANPAEVAPAPVVLIPDAQPQSARERGAVSAWARENPTASKELAAWMNKYPESATRLVQWAHDNPTQVETFVTWSLGHRYEDTRAFLLGRTGYEQLEKMRADDPDAVNGLLSWNRRSEASAEVLVKNPRGLVWVATNIYDQKPPAPSAAEARERKSEATTRAKSQSK